MQPRGQRLWFVQHMHACAVKRAVPHCAHEQEEDLSRQVNLSTHVSTLREGERSRIGLGALPFAGSKLYGHSQITLFHLSGVPLPKSRDPLGFGQHPHLIGFGP